MMKKIIVLTLISLIVIPSLVNLQAQDRRQIFLGFQPGITKEKFYSEQEFDINVVPLVLQIPMMKRVDLRIVTLANYHFGPNNQFSDLGINVLAPVYFKKKDLMTAKSQGFYLAPLLGVGRNLVADHFTTTFGSEAGYLFPATKSFTLSLGMQFGGSYFLYDNQANILRQHFGFKVNLGFWI